MKNLILFFFVCISLSLHAAGPMPAGDSCANGVLICNNTCYAPGAPGYDDKYIAVCDGTTWDGNGTLTAPQLPPACSVPAGGGTISCGGAACITAAAGLTKVKGKTSSSTPAIPYVKYVRGNADQLQCQLVYSASCAVKTVPNGMCKKAGAMIPPKSSTQTNTTQTN